MSLTVEDLEKIQGQLSLEYLDYQLELQEGNIVIMEPSDIESSEIGAELIRLLGNWVKPRRLGRVFDSSGGFILPNLDLRAPDVSFVLTERLRQNHRNFASLVPDLVVEIKSRKSREKNRRKSSNVIENRSKGRYNNRPRQTNSNSLSL
jgi:Uma2 family endonuclease